MATAFGNRDALGLYNSIPNSSSTDTSNHLRGLAQRNEAESLGGSRSSTEVVGLFPHVTTSIHGLRIDRLSPSLTVTDSHLVRVTDKDTGAVAYSDDGGSTFGTAVVMAAGDTVVLRAATGNNKWIRVTRVSSSYEFDGDCEFTAVIPFNNAVSQSNSTDADRTANKISYRCVYLYAHGTESVENVVLSITGGEFSYDTETPSSLGEVETLRTGADLDEEATPTGKSFVTSNINVGTMSAGDVLAVWIKRDLTSNQTGDASRSVTLTVNFDNAGTSYSHTYRANYKSASTVTVPAIYQLYEQTDGGGFSVVATSNTLPLSYTVTPPGAGTDQKDYYLTLSNLYNLESVNTYHRSIIIDTNGNNVYSPVSRPTEIVVSALEGGKIRVEAGYSRSTDRVPADRFAVYITANGVDPNVSTDTPTLVEFAAPASNLQGITEYTLDETYGPFPKDADVRVVVRMHRTVDTTESDNTTAIAVSASTLPPGRPILYGNVVDSATAGFGGTESVAIDESDLILLSKDLTTNGTLDIISIRERGTSSIELDTGSSVALEWIYDSGPKPDYSVYGLWTMFGLVFDTVSGSGTGTLERVDDGLDDIMYVNVGGTRRMKIDFTNQQITVGGIVVDPDGVAEGRSSEPIVQYSDYFTLFNVFDRYTEDYVTVMSLDSDGKLTSRLPIKSITNFADIPGRAD